MTLAPNFDSRRVAALQGHGPFVVQGSGAADAPDERDGLAPRARILAAASDLFYRHGIRAVGVEAIAEAAHTNKMTLYRHFVSKDELVAEYLRQSAKAADSCWARFAQAYPGDARAQLRAWLEEMAAHVASNDERGCPLVNAAVELPEKGHPARRVILPARRAPVTESQAQKWAGACSTL